VIAFWFFVAVWLSLAAGFVLGIAWCTLRQEDEADAGTDELPPRHRRTPPRPWTPADKPSRWAVPAAATPPVDEQEPTP
jgi:hypothetical protein